MQSLPASRHRVADFGHFQRSLIEHLLRLMVPLGFQRLNIWCDPALNQVAVTVIGLEETLYETFERLAMPFEQQKELFSYARKLGIEIFSTPFDIESVDFLEKLNVGLYKIASMDLVNLPFIKYLF